MKHFALLISILSITFSCANQKDITKKHIDNTIQTNPSIPINKPSFSPSTLALNIKILKIISNEDYTKVTGQIEKTLGSGSSIIGNYSKNKRVTFTTKHKLNFKVNSIQSFLFRELQSMSNKSELQLIKKIK